jgi:DNA repair protein RecO (recombination protein O)
MPLVETEGLILRSYGLSEADKIVVLFTREEGLVRGVAKGARRLKSRFGSSLEPFTIVHIEFFRKEERELVTIQRMDLIKSYFDIASDPDFLQKFAYLADVLMAFTPPHDVDETLYRMVKTCLDTAAQNLDRLAEVALYFELWLLRLGGYLPDWNKCDVCERVLGENEDVNLQMNFHLLCGSCEKTRSSRRIMGAHREIYGAVQSLSPAQFVDYAAGKREYIEDISQTFKRIIAHILGRESVGEKSLITSL